MVTSVETNADGQPDRGSNNLEAAVERDRFFSVVRANLNAARGRTLRGTEWHWDTDEGSGVVRSCSLSGSERTWKGGFKKVGIAIAAVSPHDRPLTAHNIVAECRSLIERQPDREVPRLIGLCSAEGFTTEALVGYYDNCGLGKDTSIVLVEPTRNGWAVHGVKNANDDRVRKLFDPEGDADRKQRLLDEMSGRRVELGSGILIDDLARVLDLDRRFVADALRQEAKSDRSVRLFEISGCVFVFRTSGQRIRRMGILSNIFGSREKQQDREDLELERAAMQKRRDMVYIDIEVLEGRETEKVAEGKKAAKAKSSAVRRVAAEVAELRKDIERHHQTAALLSQKINIASTHIHNLAMNNLQGTGTAALPTEDELTDTAVEMEEMIEDTRRVSELADSLRSDQSGLVASTEETEIMREFEQDDDSGGQESNTGFAAKGGFEPETFIPPEESVFILPEESVRQAAEQPNTAERSAEAS